MVRLKVASEDLVRLGVNESLASSYDDTELRERIGELEEGKVDKVTGKGLSTNDYTDEDKAEVGKIEGLRKKTYNIPLEIGDIYFTSTYWEYISKTTRIRTPKGFTVHLKVGDTIGFTDYTDLRFYIGWRDKNGGYKSAGWNRSDITVSEDGEYAILISNVTEKTITDISDLASRLRVISYMDANDIVTEPEISKIVNEKVDGNYIETDLYNNGFIPILPSGYYTVANKYPLQYNSELKTITIYADAVAFNKNVNGNDSITELSTTTIDLSSFSTTAIKIVFNLSTKQFYAKAYNNANTPAERFVALIRTTTKQISTTLPYIVDGKPYGIELYENSNIKSVNHRGYGDAPENTLSAYKLSRKMGFDYVETDVSFTSDGVAVCLHDSTIDRTSNGTGNISEMTFEQVRQYDFGSWKNVRYTGEKIPSFDEFIKLCKNLGLHPYIELKSNGSYTQNDIESCINIVKANGMKGNVTWISFSNIYLGYVKTLDPSARLGYVCDAITDTIITNANALKTDSNDVFIDASAGSITQTLVNKCVSADLPLEVWTVNFLDPIISLNPYISGVTSDYLNAGKILIDANI